jgi:hypothetical protein
MNIFLFVINYIIGDSMKTKVNSIDKICELMNKNKGYITSSELDQNGIHRMYLKMLLKKKIIRKVDKGIYLDVNVVNDKLYTYYLRNQHFIYSHFTSLYLHNIVGTIRGKYDLTITNEYHNPLLKTNNLYFVNDKIYNLGKEKVKTKCGNIVMCYNLERTICDLIRSVKRLNEHDVDIMIKRYLKDKNCDLDKLYDYAKKMNIYEEVYSKINR